MKILEHFLFAESMLLHECNTEYTSGQSLVNK